MKRIGFVVSAVRVFQASVLTVGLWSLAGCGSSVYVTPAPVILPAGGTYTSVVPNVSITDSLVGFGVTIYYTTDGSTPTTASQVYTGSITGPFTVGQSETVKAIAASTAFGSSPVVSATFVLNLPPAPTPSITPVGGGYGPNQAVTISDALSGTGTAIYYTIDGSTPTAVSTLYTAPIVLNANATVQAIEIAAGDSPSPVASASYVVQASTPAISPAAATYSSAQTVAITDITPGITIHYTVDGSTPTASSPVYSAPITVAQSETVQAIATGSNNANSQVASAAYVIKYPAATPTFSPGTGTYTVVQNVTIADTTPGATIYYTTDNSTPTTASAVYNTPIVVAQTETLQAIAVASGYSNSVVGTAAYTLNIPTTPTPVFTPAAGTYSATQSVTIADSLSGTVIHYTTDGSTPTTASPVYSGAITVSSSTQINVLATVSGYNTSSATATYYLTTGAINLTGAVMTGTIPVYNSIVNLYAAGTSGYGTGATLLATATTDVHGNFQFTKLSSFGNGVESGSNWSCPASDPNPDPQIYLTAVGGNTQNTAVTTTNNTAAGFLAAIGPCSAITGTTTVQMNELTTVATTFALAQYINPGSSPGGVMIGTKGANISTNTPQGAIGLNNAVAGIVNFANIGTGAAVTSVAHTGTNPSVTSVIVTATPETAKLTTIANILASCINGSSSVINACTDLFASAVPPTVASVTSQPAATFAAAQDTIQAAYYMAVNPVDAGTFTTCATDSGATTKLGCLFNLASNSPPYPSGLTATPTDWTLSVSYAAYTSGTATYLASDPNRVNNIASYNCSDAHSFLYGAQKSAVDAYGNLWFTNAIGHTNNIAAISPIGKPIFCAQSLNPSGDFSSGITVDTAGNIWSNYSGSTAQIFEIPSPGAVPAATTLSTYAATQLASPTTSQTTGIAADGYGNVFYTINTTGTGSTSGMSVYEIPAGTTSASATASYLVGTNNTATGVNAYGAVDSLGRIYFGSNSPTDALVEATPASASISGYTITGGNITFTTSNNTFTVNQKVILSGLTSADGVLLNRQQLTLTAVSSTSFTASTSLASTTGSVSDSGMAIAVPTGASSYSLTTGSFGISTYGAALDNNNYYYAGTSCCSSVTLLKATISPTGAAIASQPGNYAFSAQNIGGLTGLRSIALDGAGNLWFGNQYASNDGGVAESATTGIFSIGEAYTSGTGSAATFTALSPAPTGLGTGDTCLAGSGYGAYGCPVGGGFQKSTLGYTTGIAIDPSGNVWAPNFTMPSNVPVTGFGDANIVEVLGAAVPVVTPLSVGAANATLATKP